jgi:hypothetical protein
MTETQDDYTSYRVTTAGYRQIEAWMREHYKPSIWDRLVTPADVMGAVYAWADEAENSQNGEIEMLAHWTQSGRIEYLRPERELFVMPEAL